MGSLLVHTFTPITHIFLSISLFSLFSYLFFLFSFFSIGVPYPSLLFRVVV